MEDSISISIEKNTKKSSYITLCKAKASRKDVIPFEERLAKIREHLAFCNDSIDCSEKPVFVTKIRRRNSSGYAWRGTELTRQQLLCLLVFSQGMNNQQTAHLLGISAHVITARSTGLRYRLRFSNREEMVLTAKETGFANHIPGVLIDSLFDEIQLKKAKKS